jgi:hypothetical protein
VGNVMPFGPGRKLQSWFQARVAIPHDSFEIYLVPCDLENHDKPILVNICNIVSTFSNQGACKIV